MANIYLANDKFYAELTQEYQPGDTTIYLTVVPDHVPTILVAGYGTVNETVFTVTNKTLNAITGVAKLKGANVELLLQTPMICLNNEEFINQFNTIKVPAGGTTNQILKKTNNTDYVTEWTNIVDLIYPIGSIYISVVSTNPSTLFGGTWVAFGAGKTLVGLDATQTEFDTVEETGGDKTINIAHTHGLSAGAAQIGSDLGEANTLAFTASQNGSLTGTIYSIMGTQDAVAASRSHNTALTGSTDSGGSTTSSNLPPYIVTYMFKRTV